MAATPLPTRVADRLRSRVFDTIWNEPESRTRVNFELSPVGTGSTISSLDLTFTRLMMPLLGIPMRVYGISRSVYLGWGAPRQLKWMTTKDHAAQTGVDLVTYDYSGRVIDPSKVWIYYCPYTSTVYTAIPNYILLKCTSDFRAPMYQTMFRDTDRTIATQTVSVTVTNPVTDQIPITAFLATIPAANQPYVGYFLNGKYILPEKIGAVKLAVGDQVFVMYDPDITTSIDIDVDNQTTGYFSELYGEYRELLHTPKALNPDNLLLRAQDVSLIIYDPVSGEARYLHRLTNHFMENVTHSDFSVSRATLNAFRDAMGVSEVYIRVLYRNGREPRYLTHDLNCMVSLYQRTDADIVDFLLGIKDVGMPEWTAAHLEKSTYISLMDSAPDLDTPSLLSSYTDALGWYRVANLLTQMRSTYVYQQADVLIRKPSYLMTMDVDATVFANGLKVNDYFVQITQQGQHIQVGFKPGANVAVGSRIDVVMSKKALRAPTTMTPQPDQPSYIVAGDEFTIYREDTLDTPADGVCGSYDKVYTPISVGAGRFSVTPVTAGFQVTFDQPQFGKTFFLVSKLGRDCLPLSVDTILSKGDPIVLPLTYKTQTGSSIPIVDLGRVSVYVNGRRLVPDLDYTNTPVIQNSVQIVESPIVISNLTYFLPKGNVVEVILDDFTTLFRDTGYSRTGVCWRGTIPWVWGDQMGAVFVRGALSASVEDKQSYLLVQSDQQDGSPFYTEVLLDPTVASFMGDLSANLDYDIRSRSNRLTPTATPDIVNPVIIKDAYSLYSPYLTQIIQDLVSRSLIIGMDDSDALFLQQFSAYDLLKERDPVIGMANPNINRNLVDLSVSYKNPTVTDSTLVYCIDRLVKLTFNNKTPTLENTLV